MLIKAFKWLLFSTAFMGIIFVLLQVIYPISIEPANHTSRIITAKDGTWLYAQTNAEQKWRFSPDISKLDPMYLQMLIRYEDKRFWSHFGLDPLAMGRAIGQLIINGRITSGGSTITMQLARLLEPKERTVLSKFIEIFRAFQLEIKYSKKEILQAYLTLAPYGGNTEGIIAASMRYFGKPPYSLSASEAALLVSLPQSPERNRPDKHPKKSKKARDKVLQIMQNQHVISRDYCVNSIKDMLPGRAIAYPRHAAHLSQKLLHRSSSNTIITTLDSALQIQIEQWAIKKGESLPKGSTLAILVAENNSSEIKAYIGSHDMFHPKIAGYIDMIPVSRSPGSALKPFIYGLGFEEHIIHPSTHIYDIQTRFGDYTPHNFSRKFRGEVSIAYALQHSLNIPVIKVLHKIGPQKFIDRIEKLASPIQIPKNKATLPIALGGLGISMWQMASLYVALANDGTATPLHYLTGTAAPKKKRKKLLSQEAARMTTAILRKITPPKGYRNKNELIAYKTGTSYGYRDLWAAAYTPQYTVIIWIGKANNAPQLRHTGLELAAPMAFEVFSLIHSFYAPISWPWQPSDIIGQAPLGLKHFNKEITQRYAPLQFVYPRENTKYYSEGCHDAFVQVSIQHGQPPYYWYLDEKPSDITQPKYNAQFATGAHTITVIDSIGHSATRHIWVLSPDCQEKKSTI